jgi:translation initiation factor 3 subunit J
MSDWENDFDEDEPIVPVVKKKWDDEDVEDDIKDSWEESDEEEKPQPAAAPAKKKIPLAQKIAERQAEEEKKKQEMEAKRSQLVGYNFLLLTVPEHLCTHKFFWLTNIVKPGQPTTTRN